MVNELQSEPFYKPNLLAMLNTLFPPSMKDMPNDKVNIATLQKHRATFYKYILAVEQQGSNIVEEFVQKLLEPETKHSWPSTVRELEEYITLADSMIREAKDIDGADFFNDSSSFGHSRTTSNAYSTDRPRTASSANTNYDDYRFSFSASSPAATVGSNASNSTSTKGFNNLFDSDSTFILPPTSTNLTTDPLTSLQIFSQHVQSVSAITSDPRRSSPSTDQHNDFVPKENLAALSTQSSTKLHAHEADPAIHSSPVANNEMRRIKRALSRSVSKTNPSSHAASDTSYDELSPSTTSWGRPAKGGLDFLSHPYQPEDPLGPDHTGTIKRKKSFSEIFLRRKSSTAKEKNPLRDNSSLESGVNESSRSRKLRSSSNLNQRHRAQAWTDVSKPSSSQQPNSRDKADQLSEDRKDMPSPDLKYRKSFSFSRSRTPKHLMISAKSSLENIPNPPRTPKTPSLFSRPTTPSFVNRPKTPTRETDSPLPILGDASSLTGLDESNKSRNSIFPLPLTLRQKLSRSDLKGEKDRELEMERQRQWLIEKSLRERGQSRERAETNEGDEELDAKDDTLERKGSRKEMIWQDGGASGKASGWVEFEGPRKLPSVPPLPVKSVFRSKNS
jgi:hypothetical protein